MVGKDMQWKKKESSFPFKQRKIVFFLQRNAFSYFSVATLNKIRICKWLNLCEQRKQKKKSGQKYKTVNIPITQLFELIIIIIMNVVVASSGGSLNKIKTNAVCIRFSLEEE